MVALAPDHGLEPYYRRELEQRWRASTREQRRRGKEWYPTARDILAGIAADTGYTLEQAVAVMAVTSPMAQVSTNVEWTRRALESHGAAKVGRFPARMMPKVRRILADADYANEYVRGPKVGPFFRAILGSNELVLDRWAIYAAAPTVDRENHSDVLRKSVRAALEDAYRNAARAARRAVRDYQATIWLQTRESTPVDQRGRAVIRRLVDITTAA